MREKRIRDYEMDKDQGEVVLFFAILTALYAANIEITAQYIMPSHVNFVMKRPKANENTTSRTKSITPPIRAPKMPSIKPNISLNIPHIKEAVNG